MDCVVGYHLNAHTCGIARFNHVLASRLGVPLVGIGDPDVSRYRDLLLSIKTSEFSDGHIDELRKFVAELGPGISLQLFLHDFTETELEMELVRKAARIYCGNGELAGRLRAIRPDVIEAWCPGSLLEATRFERTQLSVFSFGMAHKVRSDHFERLETLLRDTGKSYSLYVSTALHEGTTFEGSFSRAFAEIREIFRGKVFFLGYLSDAAVYNHLVDTTYFAAFFEKGVRANNTSVNAAMECGSVVITNLDRYSPGGFEHGRNLIDVTRCDRLPTDPGELGRISEAARACAGQLGWDRLTSRLLRVDGGAG